MAQLLSPDQLQHLRAPFYRVAVKGLLFDSDRRLAVVINSRGVAELPGGGWEGDETIGECITREIFEETGGRVTRVGDVQIVMRGTSSHGWPVVRLIVPVAVEDTARLGPRDTMQAIQFLTKEEFCKQEFSTTDREIQTYADTIWSRN